MFRRVASLSLLALGLLTQTALGDDPINPGFPYGSQKGLLIVFYSPQ